MVFLRLFLHIKSLFLKGLRIDTVPHNRIFYFSFLHNTPSNECISGKVVKSFMDEFNRRHFQNFENLTNVRYYLKKYTSCEFLFATTVKLRTILKKKRRHPSNMLSFYFKKDSILLGKVLF